MIIRHIVTVLLAATLSACGGDQPAPGEATRTSGVSAPAASVDAAAGSPSADSGDGLEGIVLRVAPGGRPDAYCVPQWSIANQTTSDIPGLLIQIAWHGPDGQILQDIGEFATLQEDLSAGRQVDRTLEGHLVACDQLRIVVATYACRDQNAVRMSCPGPVHVLTDGGVQADTTALAEGSLRGAVEG